MSGSLDELEMPLDDALEDIGAAAKTLAVGEGSAVAAAAEMAAVSLQKRPDAEALALWLADADRRPDSAQRLGGGRPYDLVAVAGG